MRARDGKRRAVWIDRVAPIVLIFVAAIVLSSSSSAQIPDPPLPVDPRPLTQLMTAADRDVLADADNPKEVVEAYLKISETHLQAAFNAIRGNNYVLAESELDIYNKAVASAGKQAFGLQEGKRPASKKIEQALYKQIKTLESIERLFPSEREMYAEAALKQTKQLRMQALNEAFASGEVLKDPDGDKKPQDPPIKDGAAGPHLFRRLLPQAPSISLGMIYCSSYSVPGSVLGCYSLSEATVVHGVLQTRGDYLTEEEDDQVRQAQEPDLRAKVFMKIADRRLRAIVEPAPAAPLDKKQQKKAEEEEREWGAVPKVSREELLRHYARAVAECMNKLEDAYERNPKSSALPKALSVLRDATDKHLETLRKLKPEMKTDDEVTAMSSALYEAETANKGARDGLK